MKSLIIEGYSIRGPSTQIIKPNSGRIAVKVINHLGDEVMKVYKVG